MYIRKSTVALFLAATLTANAFVPSNNLSGMHKTAMKSTVAEVSSDDKIAGSIRSQINYQAGKATTEFAKRFGHMAGAQVKTVGESFAEFTNLLGFSVNPLYKGMVTDLVGTTHLVLVNARFQRDPVWSLGMMSTLDLLLKNYPEPEVRGAIVSALFKSVGLDEATVRAEAAEAEKWVSTMTKAEIEEALEGKGASPLAQLAKTIQDDSFWMYSRYFGIGLVKIMEQSGTEMDKDEVYPIMEDWMGNKLQKSHLTACSDSDLYFKVREKLDMMETMMKEIEIREKKRMAERLEDKAEAALRAADREEKLQKEIANEAARNRERVA